MANLDCKICFEKFDCVKHKPCILKPCGHTFCLVCIDKFREKKCPKCNGLIEDKKQNEQLLDMLFKSSDESQAVKSLEVSLSEAEKLNKELKSVYENRVKENSEIFKALNTELNAKTEEIIVPINLNQRKLLNQIKEIYADIKNDFDEHVINETEKLEARMNEAKSLLNEKEVTSNQLEEFIKRFVIEKEQFFRLIDNFQAKSVYVFEKSDKSIITTDFIGKLGKKTSKIELSNSKPKKADTLNEQSNITNIEEKLHYHMSEAVKYLHILKMKKAIEHLDEIIKIDPSFHDPFGKKAYALGHLLRYEEALPYYILSLKYLPECYQTYFHQGESFRELFKYKESIQSFKECIRIDPNNAEAYFEIARVYAQGQDCKKSLIYFNQADILEPNNFNYAHYKALALMGSLKFDEANVYLDAALANNPLDFQLYIAKAGVYEAKGRPDLALKCYDKVVELDPHMTGCSDITRRKREELTKMVGKRR